MVPGKVPGPRWYDQQLPHHPISHACSGHPALPHPLQGCVGAVRRVAEKLPGVTGVDIDLAAQKVGRPRVCAC